MIYYKLNRKRSVLPPNQYKPVQSAYSATLLIPQVPTVSSEPVISSLTKPPSPQPVPQEFWMIQ